MITDMIVVSGFSKSPVVDWKIDELAIAMASAEPYAPNHPMGYRRVIVDMDTTGTEIESHVELVIATEGGEKRLLVFFTISIMRDSQSYAGVRFAGQDLNNWARSVGIVP